MPEELVTPNLCFGETDGEIVAVPDDCRARCEHGHALLLYTPAGAKLTCGERLRFRHARQAEIRLFLKSLPLQAEREQWPLLRDLPATPMALRKFKGRLTPAQMKQDLEFTAAPDNEPYRENKIVW